MNEPLARTRTPSCEAQLRALANGVDRGNRPTGLILLGLVVIVGFGVYTAAAAVNWTRARTGFARASGDAARVRELLEEFEKEKAKTPDLATIFPPLTTMGDDIEKTARKAFGNSTATPVTGLNVGAKVQGRLWQPELEKVLDVYSVSCQANDLPLDKTLQWIADVEQNSLFGHIFVTSLTLNPAQAGWQTMVTFTAYEKKR